MNFIARLFGAGRINRAAPRDFRPEDLPATRPKLFADALLAHWSSMVGVNLVYLLVWLPAVVWVGVNFFALDLLAGADGEGLLSALFTCLLVLWPLIALTGPATAGVTYVMRNWARGEHSFPFSDAVEHARKNWKQALAVSTITGALPLLALLLLTFYEGMIRQVNALFVVPLGLGLMAMILWALMLEVVYTLMVTYRLRFAQLLKNAALLAVARLPLFAAMRLATLLLPAAALISLAALPGRAIYVWMAAGFFYIAFGLALNRLLYASLANAVCEKYINPTIGAPVNIGMRTQTPPPDAQEE